MRNPICLALCLAGASAGALADATIYRASALGMHS